MVDMEILRKMYHIKLASKTDFGQLRESGSQPATPLLDFQSELVPTESTPFRCGKRLHDAQ